MKRYLKFIIGKTIRNRTLQHTMFWCLSFLILVNILKVSAEVKQIDLIYAAVFHIPIVMVVYANLRILFPWLWEKERYFFYAVSVLVLAVFGAGFYLILFNKWIDLVFEGYYFIAFYSFWDISLYFAIYLFASSLLRLARGWFRIQELEKEKTLAELKALKSQVNPHFLFNSLNSIYSLARKKSNEVPEKIVQLSDLMRHIIYDSELDFIPLEKELEMVGNYIELQNLRSGSGEKIDLIISGDVSGKKIAPLIFLPFIENSFKHGLKGGADQVFVTINVEVLGSVLNVEIENSKGEVSKELQTRYKGIGIENVRKRLELIYPEQHALKISNKEDSFKVLLQLQLK